MITVCFGVFIVVSYWQILVISFKISLPVLMQSPAYPNAW